MLEPGRAQGLKPVVSWVQHGRETTLEQTSCGHFLKSPMRLRGNAQPPSCTELRLMNTQIKMVGHIGP